MNEPNIQNAIRLVKVKFPEFHVSSSDFLQDGQINGLNMNLEHNVMFTETTLDSFIVQFILKLSNKENSFNVNVKMVAFFKTQTPIDEVFKNSAFVQVNAPAIAFPFLRSFITTITTNAGFSAVILPTVNFLKK